MSHQNPSRDPANEGYLTGVLRGVLDKFLQSVDNMLPARITGYDRATNRATVAPSVNVLTTGGEQVPRAPVSSVPVLRLGGGGVVLSFDHSGGGDAWIHANDRDISLTMQSGQAAPPNTLRKHSFSDGLAIPDVREAVTIAGEDAHNAVLQTVDGQVKVAIWPDRLKLAVGADLYITIGPEFISIKGDIHHDGQLYLSQNPIVE